jgi:hypothetical protein
LIRLGAKVVKTSFMRPEDKLVSPDHTIYVSDFSTYWLENESNNWNVSSKRKWIYH